VLDFLKHFKIDMIENNPFFASKMSFASDYFKILDEGAIS